MNNNEPTIEELKQSLDIIEVAKTYGELVKSGSNYKYKDNKSIIINSSKQIFSDFNGNITAGSVLDLIMYMEKICAKIDNPSKEELAQGINRLKELNGQTTYTINPDLQIKRKEEEQKKKTIDFQKLGFYAKNNIEAGLKFKGFSPLYLPKKNENDPLTFNEYYLKDGFVKLFETERLSVTYQLKVNYMMNNLLGYDEFWNCPSIILKDDTGKVVDYIAYRPKKPADFKDWQEPKYIYKNSHNRGDDFLFPFKKEVETILNKQKQNKLLVVGEGIKNGLNALLYSIPYITLESSSNKLSNKLKDYILYWFSQGFDILCMFDGDTAGKKAYDKFIEQIGHNFNNGVDFNSGLDFVNYLQSEDN